MFACTVYVQSMTVCLYSAHSAVCLPLPLTDWVLFVCVGMCNISHCGCNLSHKFLIHSLYLPQNTRILEMWQCFAVSPHLVWTSHHPSHMSFMPTFLYPSAPLPHPLPHTPCLPLGLNPSISWKKPNVLPFRSPLSLFLLCGWIVWTFPVTVPS